MVKRIKLTPKNRLKVYENVLKNFESKCTGLCYRLSYETEKLQLSMDNRAYYKMKQCFPEVYKHKPKKLYDDGYWFHYSEEGHNKRKTILKKAIKEVKSKINELK